jgi:hypothetical protein
MKGSAPQMNFLTLRVLSGEGRIADSLDSSAGPVGQPSRPVHTAGMLAPRLPLAVLSGVTC